MEKLNLSKDNLKKFGITMGIALLVVSLLVLLKHRYSALPTFAISILFLVLAFLAPVFLKGFYIIWMRFAFILGWLNTRLLLFIIFYLIFTPIGFVMILFRVDLLERKIEKKKDTYWKKKDKKLFNLANYERQF